MPDRYHLRHRTGCTCAAERNAVRGSASNAIRNAASLTVPGAALAGRDGRGKGNPRDQRHDDAARAGEAGNPEAGRGAAKLGACPRAAERAAASHGAAPRRAAACGGGSAADRTRRAGRADGIPADQRRRPHRQPDGVRAHHAHPRQGAGQSAAEDRRLGHHDDARRRRAASRRRRDAGGQGDPSVARRLLQFSRQQSELSHPQRVRERADPHQRHPAARRRVRARPHSGRQLHRQHEPAHRRAAGAVRLAHRRRVRHHDAPVLQQRR